MDKQRDLIKILGIKIDLINQKQAVEKVFGWLKESGKHYIVTPNPEFIMAAQSDTEFKRVLNAADLAIPDGSRLGWAYRMTQEKNIFKKILLFPFFLFPIKQVIQFETVAGVDLMEKLCEQAAEKGLTIGLLGGKNSVAEKTADCLQKKYPKLKVVFASDGPKVDNMGNVLSSTYYGNKTENSKPIIHNTNPIPQVDILFVAFGQVKQEKWIAKNLDKIPVKVAMGVGGAFDYLSGSVTRAPSWMRSIGLEWLFRLVLQPWRIKRQIKLLKFITLLLFKTDNA